MNTPVSSTPVLRTALTWGGVVGLAVVAGAAVVGWLVAQAPGLWSGVLGALVGVVFPALTAVSILVANRSYGHAAFLQIFFGVVLGGWLLKFVVVIVALVLILQIGWVQPVMFFFSLVAAAVAALVVDIVVLSRMRLPAVSDISMPSE